MLHECKASPYLGGVFIASTGSRADSFQGKGSGSAISVSRISVNAV